MPTMTLLPNGQNNVSSDWITVPTPQTASDALDDDNAGISYVRCGVLNEYMIIEFANPSVAEGDIDTITSVGFVSSGKSIHRSDPSVVAIAYETPSGNVSENCGYDAHRTNYETIIGTPRVYSDGPGASAWTYSDLVGLEMRCTKGAGVNGGGVYLSYLALLVEYTEAVAEDNATFFGANF